MVKKIIGRCYIWLILILMYLPILVLIAFSFTKSNNVGVWTGFTFELYSDLFHSKETMVALANTVIIAVTSAIVATILGTLLTDKERTFFSVIVPIHQAFIDNKPVVGEHIQRKRRSREQIIENVLELLRKERLSSGELYKRLGYSGNPSKTFSDCIEKLISEGKIEYTSEKMNASDNTLRLKKMK